MTTVSCDGKSLLIDGKTTVSLPYVIRQAFEQDGIVVVLMDPNDYLNDPSYTKERRRGNDPFRNLIGLSPDGNPLWEAEFPDAVDYYYKIVSRRPLVALSFSSFRCRIDIRTGVILERVFLK